MADRIPVKAIYSGTYGSSDVTSLGELSSGETINGSYITDNSVTLAKMAHGTDGELITYDATGAPANVTTGTSGQVLTSGGVGVAPTFQTAAGGGATGGGGDAVFVENELIVTTDYTLSTNKSALSVGPITLNTGVSVTVPTGHTWTIL